DNTEIYTLSLHDALPIYLYLKALEQSTQQEKEQLLHLYSIKSEDNQDKIELVKQVFVSSKATEATQKAIAEYTQKAFDVLNTMDIPSDKKDQLRMFGEGLMNRLF